MVEKEIVLELEDNENLKNDLKTDEMNNETKPSPKFIDKKQVVDLTDDERALIIANAKNGYDQPNFSVKFFKNGKHRIVKKKEQTPTVSQKAIKTTTPPKEERKYYSDNQLLFEHIIELNSKVDKLMAKHKKLKQRYQTLQNDLYVDEEDVKNEQTEERNEQPAEHEEIKKQTPKVQPQQTENTFLYTQPVRRGWRSKIKYI